MTLAFTRMPIADESCIYHSDKQSTEGGKISSFVIFALWPCPHQNDSGYDTKLCHGHLCRVLKRAD